MKLTVSLLCTYIGFVAGSLQVLAFTDKWAVLGVVLLVTIVLVVTAIVISQRPQGRKQAKTIPTTIPKRRSSSKVAKNRSAAKGKVKVVR